MVAEPTTGLPELDDALRETAEPPPNGVQSGSKARGAARSRTESSEKKAEPSATRSEPRKTSRSISVRVAKQVGVLGAGIDLLDRDGFCGNHVMDNAEELGIALENVAKENPRIAKLLEDGIESMAWINLFLVVAGIVTPIAARHAPLRRRRFEEYDAPEPDEEFPGFSGNESPVQPSEAPSAAALGGLPPATVGGSQRVVRPRNDIFPL